MPRGLATSGRDKSDASFPEIVTNHPHVKCESADFRDVIDGRHLEFNAATFVTACPGANFTLHQSPVDPQHKLARFRHPRLSEALTRIYNSDRPRRQNVMVSPLPYLALAHERELEKVKIADYGAVTITPAPQYNELRAMEPNLASR